MAETQSGNRAIVIGSGFGGLAAAIRLQAAGVPTTILEKRDKPGGRAYVHEVNAPGVGTFTFDGGPTVITAPNCLEELFAVAGRKLSDSVELMPVSPMYRLAWEDGFSFDYTNVLAETRAQIAQKSPGDLQGYDRFLEYTKEVFEEGYVKLAHVPFLSWGSMLRVAPQLLRLKAYRSVYSVVSSFIKDRHLREAFSFHSLLVGGNPFSTSSIYTLIHYLERKWGVYFPKGGTGALVQALVRLFESLGGKLELNAEVEEIRTHAGRVTAVRTKGGRVFPAEAVVSNADVARTYVDLLKGTPELKSKRSRLGKSRYSMSLFLIYFGTKVKYSNVAHHSVLFGPRYRGLLKEIFGKGKLAADFSLYLHRPTATDASLAPAGCDAFYVLSPVPHLEHWDGDWETQAAIYGEKILSALEARCLPGLRENLVCKKFYTPQNFATDLGAHLGSAFSLEPLLRQSAYFRAHNRDEKIAGLYIVGAGTHPGAGVPGVVGSAKATAGLVLEDFEAQETARALATIRTGSKSFAFASRLFPKSLRQGAHFLYGWCRYCDDAIDNQAGEAAQAQALKGLQVDTTAAFELGSKAVADKPVFAALASVVRKYQIPRRYAEDLLQGMEDDLHKKAYQSEAELEVYCYRVAGTVGLMMSHVMGVKDAAAYRHAMALGQAMQMTNIARDVLEDFAMGRVYLPAQWLAVEGLSTGSVAELNNREALARVVERLLDAADRQYAIGRAGYCYLPLRAALAVATAARVYHKIGQKVRRRGARAWDSRTVVSKFEKCLAFFGAVGDVLKLLPAPKLKGVMENT